MLCCRRGFEGDRPAQVMRSIDVGSLGARMLVRLMLECAARNRSRGVTDCEQLLFGQAAITRDERVGCTFSKHGIFLQTTIGRV